MKTVFFLLFLALAFGEPPFLSASAQTISTKTMTPGAPINVALSPQITTTILLPSVPAGCFGLGLVSKGSSGPGMVQLDHPDGSRVLVMHALTETVDVIMTVLMDNALWIFSLKCGPIPDVAITLLKSDSYAFAPKAIEVKPEEIKEARIKYDPELLIGFERRAHDAELLRKLYPDLYQGYACRTTDYSSDAPAVKTTVTRIHRFPKEDVCVIEGEIQNKTDHPITFDARATSIAVANEVFPSKLTDCLHPIPKAATVPIVCVLQGDTDGSRSNLSINNEFRIMLPPIPGEANIWSLKNGQPSGEHFKVAPPKDQPVPLTQTGRPNTD